VSDIIIKVENLSKRYRIGLQEKKADTFAQQVWNNLKAPVENFRRIKSMGKFGDEEEGVHWALKDVSFEVKQGEVLGIIGKNGAGKSTLLKILSKITEPTSGRIEMNGRVAALLEVGTGFHPELSGRENIYMNGTILGMSKNEIDRKLDEIIDFSGVEKYIDTPVKFYSSGMRVRLGFSVAAHLEPEILIVDEVLAVGDFEFQKKCLGKMQDVSKNEGRTVLFVSHNMEAVGQLCKTGLMLQSGENVFQGSSKNTISCYFDHNSKNKGDQGLLRKLNFLRSDKVEISNVSFQTDKTLVHTADINEEVDFIVYYTVNIDDVKLNLSISIYGPYGEYLIASPSNTDDVWYQKPHKIGSYKAICRFPKCFFNSISYHVNVMIVENGTDVIVETGKLFSIEYFDSGVGRRNFFGKWSGLIRPNLRWDVSKI
jgi:lipopolysaccharide transport system ATP-binding protein